MKILLDTHIWLWIQDDPDRIGRSLRNELRKPENEIFLSPISTWEALILQSKGRISMRRDPAEWVARNTAPFREAPLTHEIALVSQQISLGHRDPADRFLVATAKVLGLTLATADAKLLGFGDIATIANR
ncbi:MAG TPA: type II toxin-antitoxin system VapC family toxin [Terriglobales bacterium]|nr:type II toxin-antitoxin system VapC family toxin [Terriglobales bacterium]